MKEQFVTYEIALKLKDLGFDEPCIAYYFNRYGDVELFSEFVIDHSKRVFYTHSEYETIAPLWQQAIDWFLKKKHLYIDITFKEVKGPKIEGINSVYFDIEIYSIFGGDAWKKYRFSEISDDYYYAREQAILKAIELCKDKKQ